MQYRTLGRTGVQVSTLALGAMNFGAIGRTTQDEATAIVDAAMAGGVNFVDTSVSTNLLRDGQNCKLALDLPVCPGSYVRHRVSSG